MVMTSEFFINKLIINFLSLSAFSLEMLHDSYTLGSCLIAVRSFAKNLLEDFQDSS